MNYKSQLACRIKIFPALFTVPLAIKILFNFLSKMLFIALQFKGHAGNGSNRYSFNCQLSKFISDANGFCAELAPFLSDAKNFCTQLCSKTNGVVSLIGEAASTGIPSSSSSSLSLPSSASCGQKRGSSTKAPNAKKKKGGYQEKMNILEEEIPDHQIGMQL